jgi:hypothetical protein
MKKDCVSCNFVEAVDRSPMDPPFSTVLVYGLLPSSAYFRFIPVQSSVLFMQMFTFIRFESGERFGLFHSQKLLNGN